MEVIALGIRPIDIARELNISTAALRHYESWSIVPPVERGENGYRMYTDIHVAYFQCIRAMNDGFGMQRTAQVMRKLIAEEVDEALWIMSEAQAGLHQDKKIADIAIKVLGSEDAQLIPAKRGKKGLSIGEVSEQTTIPASAIRHWEKAGLITIMRDPDNGYRVFSPTNLRQILIIRTLKSAVWSLDTIKRIIKELDDHNVENAIQTARDSLSFLNQVNRHQLRGAYYLQRLLQLQAENG
jgi:DNA-binding transcriptional MerR regulator